MGTADINVRQERERNGVFKKKLMIPKKREEMALKKKEMALMKTMKKWRL